LLFRHKNQSKTHLTVDMNDLENEQENLTKFLQLHLKVPVSQVENRVRVDSEDVSVQELKRVVNKFVYHRNLNSTHWVSVEGAKTVKINRFKGSKKKEKQKKEQMHQTASQSWGL
jgi:hypothetical protein